MFLRNIEARWACQYYLGRAITAAELEAAAKSEDVRALFYEAPERGSQHNLYRGDEICVYRPGAPKTVVLSSCQGPAMARALAAVAHVSVFGCAVTKTRDAEMAEHILAMMETADFILIANFTETWGEFSQSSLKSRFGSKVVTYNRPFFEGLHPDQTYIDPNGPHSPVGDYHSRIVIDSYLSGYSHKKCLERFNIGEYEKIGFFDIVNQSYSKIEARDNNVDIPIRDLIDSKIRQVPLFYTINHPTPDFFDLIAREFCNLTGLRAEKYSTYLIPSVLVQGCIWPIDEAWSKHLNLEYKTEDVFWNNFFMMSREEFVWRCYRIYENVERKYLMPGIRSLKRAA